MTEPETNGLAPVVKSELNQGIAGIGILLTITCLTMGYAFWRLLMALPNCSSEGKEYCMSLQNLATSTGVLAGACLITILAIGFFALRDQRKRKTK